MITIFDKIFIVSLKKQNKLLNNLYTKNREYVIVKLVGDIMEKNITLEEINIIKMRNFVKDFRKGRMK